MSDGAPPRDRRLLSLLDAARELAEAADAPSNLRGRSLDELETAALVWAAEECPTCGRRGDHEWAELTVSERVAHEAEAAAQGT